MEFTMLIIAMLFMSGYSTVLRFAVAHCKNTAQQLLFNGLFCTVAVLPAAIACMGQFAVSSAGVVFVLLHGCFFLLTVLLNLKAVECGPLSATTLIVNLSLALPILYSCIFLDEIPTLPRILGLVLLAVCLVLFAEPGKKTGSPKGGIKWFLLSIGAMVSNGLLTIFSKAYMEQCEGRYAAQYVFWGYAAAALAAFITFALMPKKKTIPMEKTKFLSLGMVGLTIAIGLCSFGGNYLVTCLASVMDGAVLYPFVQGGSIVVTTLISRVFLKEKLSVMKWVAVVIGTCSVVLLNL